MSQLCLSLCLGSGLMMQQSHLLIRDPPRHAGAVLQDARWPHAELPTSGLRVLCLTSAETFSQVAVPCFFSPPFFFFIPFRSPRQFTLKLGLKVFLTERGSLAR